ncbi:MAG TPA: thioredoxin domain-containing protein [Rhodanobacteraceae bacterium]|nr:thioredoxin domain-containing protein [Rhodanobacteraceae bacterium]
MKNELAHASSPYLRQHAGNPVHWQEWSDTTLAHAKQDDTPILLSIGYSACHWCHVMAHESFESEPIAQVMNASFVNIKLDREERPDLDRVYQLAHQALSGRGGGWPLTVFLDPQDLTPFFAGTYFPPQPRHGLPGFGDLLQRVRAFYDTHRDELRKQNAELRGWIAHAGETAAGEVPGMEVIGTTLERIAAHFDPENGGHVGAPKFPHAGELELLLDVAFEPLSPVALLGGEGGEKPLDPENCAAMAMLTLRNMAARGLQDHLGGGFFRYCVDALWTIPHFEKMLYDNAQLLPLYARAAEAFGDVACEQAAGGIVEWSRREMTAGSGAFFSALDADSEGAEGRLDEGAFYVWTREQLREVLEDDGFAAIEAAYGLDGSPNFEDRAWHLVEARTLEQIAQQLDSTPGEIRDLLASARKKLFIARAKRVRPATDDKILTSWNALMISALARGARSLQRPRWAEAADKALAAVREGAWVNGALHANVAGERARIPGFLDDHAFLLAALLELLQCRWRDEDLQWAIALADTLLEKFEDTGHGGFRFSSAEHATPLQNPRTFTDEALPSGNGVAALALLRLGHLLGETRFLEAAERCLRAASDALRKYPDACCTLVRALREFHAPRAQVVIRCREGEENSWREALREMKAARVDAFVIPADADALPGVLTQRKPADGGIAYLCTGLSCRAPIRSAHELAAALRKNSQAP